MKEKFIFMSTQLLKGVKQIIKTFLIEDYFHFSPVSATLVVHLSCKYLREFSKKLEMALLVYSGAWEKLIHEKNLKYKIS